jgi:hypothetical protein
MTQTLLPFPEIPEALDGDVEADAAALRYDDVIQDGRLRLDATWRPTGKLLWGHPAAKVVFDQMDRGVTNVMARVSLQATEIALRPRAKGKTRVRFRFEQASGRDGAAPRLLFTTWVSAYAEMRDGSMQLSAQAFGQRVFTRLHAPPGQHLVTELPGFGPSGVPAHRTEWVPVTTVLDAPDGVEWLEPAPRLAPAPVVFGLSHTDLNQHVNFLMYHHAVESSALARFVELGVGARLAAREVSFGYRKPSFAGEVLRVALRAFRAGDRAFGVVAAIVEEDGGPFERASFRDFGSPRTVAQMLLRP